MNESISITQFSQNNMSQKPDQISGVPTNIITGFLGVGKTSTILHLLKNKPEQERWAVLVNEFGEIGIDGSIVESLYSEQQGVFIREVPGGCMCCTAGLPMQVALTQLLRHAKPDRLLIEPAGLGHPSEVLQTLSNESFCKVLAVQKVLTLVDARHLKDSRYVEHETFQQQLAIADVIIANKQDLYDERDRDALDVYIKENSLSEVPLFFAEQGVIESALLDGSDSFTGSIAQLANWSNDVFIENVNGNHSKASDAIPECGFIKAVNKGEGYVSAGWRFSPRFIFNRDSLFALISGINAERLKATFITDSGCFAYNFTRDSTTEIPLEHLDESRIEIIASETDQNWESMLFECISGNHLLEKKMISSLDRPSLQKLF